MADEVRQVDDHQDDQDRGGEDVVPPGQPPQQQQQQPQQQEPDPALLWQAVINNVTAVPNAIARGDRAVEALTAQLERDANIRGREQERARWERLVPMCSGLREDALQEWIRAIDQAPPELRRELALRTTQGALAETVRVFVEGNPGGGWEDLRAHIAREYLSQDYRTAMRQELSLVGRGPHEQLPAFLRRYRRLADEAYPPGRRSEEAGEIIVKSLARALGDDKLVRKMIQGGFPTVQQAFDRLLHTEQDQVALERLTGKRFEDNGGQNVILAALAKALEAGKPATPQPPLEKQQTATEMEKMRIKIRQLEERLSSTETAGKTAKGGKGNTAIKCFRCGGPHLKRDCPKGTQTAWGQRKGAPRSGCFLCGGPHFARECNRATQPMAPVTASVWSPSVPHLGPQQATAAPGGEYMCPMAGGQPLN